MVIYRSDPVRGFILIKYIEQTLEKSIEVQLQI